VSSPTAVRAEVETTAPELKAAHQPPMRPSDLTADSAHDSARRAARWEVKAVVAATTGAAMGVGVEYIRPPAHAQEWWTLLIVVILVAILETRGGMTLPFGKASIHFSAKAYASVGAVYLLGLPGAAASSISALVMGVVVWRGLNIRVWFNSVMSLLVYASAFWVFHSLEIFYPWTGNTSSLPHVAWLLGAGAVGGLAAWVTNHILLGLVMLAEQGAKNFRFQQFSRHIVNLMPYYLGYGLTGVGVLAASHWLNPIAALLTLAAPVAIVQTTTNRWMREQQARAVEAQNGFNATLVSLSKAIDLRDSDTEGHCRRVVDYSLMMGRFLNFSDDELLRLCHGALLHDIGKIGVPDAILHKPGPLTEQEWDVMRTHPQLGALMVADVRQLEKAREVILSHHERYDGKGYPNGLAGPAVPLAARVFTIADAFDAMVSDRPYRKAMSLTEARWEVQRCSGTQFDPEAVRAFNSISDAELEAVSNEREQPTEELLSLGFAIGGPDHPQS
jgi:hypothetical protein